MAFYVGKSKDNYKGSHVTTLTPAVQEEEVDRPFMIKPNNLEYFYDEKEDEQIVYDTHKRLNFIWLLVSSGSVVFGIWAAQRYYR